MTVHEQELAQRCREAEELLDAARDALRRVGWEQGDTPADVARKIDGFLSDIETERRLFSREAAAQRRDVAVAAVLDALVMPRRPKNLETAERVADAVLASLRSAGLRA